MQTADVTIHHAAGLHARPASQFVRAASRFHSTITVRAGERQASAKSIVQVLTLGVTQGTRITITAEGDDEADVIATLVTLVATNFEAM